MSDGVLSAKPEACGQRKVGLHTNPTWVVLFGLAANPLDRGAVQVFPPATPPRAVGPLTVGM